MKNKGLSITILALSVALGIAFGWAIHPDVKVVNKDASILNVEGNQITLGENDEFEYIIEGDQDIGPTINKYEGDAFAQSVKFSNISYGGLGKSLMHLNTSPAEINVGGAKGTLGAFAYKASLTVNNGPVLIIIIGCLCIIGGIVVWIYWNKKLGMWTAIAGVVLLVIGLTFASYPWIGLLLIPLGIGAVVYYWYNAKKGNEKDTTLKAIVGGIETLPEKKKAEVTGAISTEAKANGTGSSGTKPVVSKVVSDVKRDII